MKTSTKLRQPRNKFETKLFNQLTRSKVKFKYESEKLPYYWSGHYIPDFVVHTRSGVLYIEAKGYLRPDHKRKMVAVKKLHPTLDIRIVFYTNKPKDIRWAEKHGFPWAIDTIPESWINE